MKKTYLGISIDTDKDKLLSTQAAKLLKEYYCIDGEDSPQMAFARASRAYCYGDRNLHKEFIIMFLTNGLCLHHLYYQMHLNQMVK